MGGIERTCSSVPSFIQLRMIIERLKSPSRSAGETGPRESVATTEWSSPYGSVRLSPSFLWYGLPGCSGVVQ